MPEPTNIHRFNNYPHKFHESVERERYIDTEGGTYLITVLDEEGNFKLELPTDEKGKYDSITDSFNEFKHRASLYKRLDKGVYEFILETMNNQETEYLKQKGNRP